MAKGKGDQPSGFEEMMTELHKGHPKIPFRGQDEPDYRFQPTYASDPTPHWFSIILAVASIGCILGGFLYASWDIMSMRNGVIGVVIAIICVFAAAIITPGLKRPHKHDDKNHQ